MVVQFQLVPQEQNHFQKFMKKQFINISLILKSTTVNFIFESEVLIFIFVRSFSCTGTIFDQMK
jgi:hypothetical protein